MQAIKLATVFYGIIFLTTFTVKAQVRVIDVNNLEKRDELIYEINKKKPYTGKAVDLYENGQKKFESNWKNGTHEGLWTEWYYNGQKESEGYFINDVKTGLWTEWDENGNVISTETY